LEGLIVTKLIQITPKEHEKYTAISKVEITLHDEASVDEMLEAYKRFLQACGYILTGDFVMEEKNEDN